MKFWICIVFSPADEPLVDDPPAAVVAGAAGAEPYSPADDESDDPAAAAAAPGVVALTAAGPAAPPEELEPQPAAKAMTAAAGRVASVRLRSLMPVPTDGDVVRFTPCRSYLSA
jgi:hypothetical protein